MVGIFDNLIHQWVKNNLNLVDTARPISIHITDLLSIELKSEEVIGTSISIFSRIVREIIDLGNPVQPILTIPLISESHHILQKLPVNIDDLMLQIDYFEPPSIYLVSWNRIKKIAPVEEFKIPLGFNLFDEQDVNYYSYYREHRYAIALKESWEFTRGIYIEYYPQGMLEI